MDEWLNRLDKSLASSRSKRRMSNVTGNKTLDRISTAVYLGQQAKDFYNGIQERYRKRTTWVITVHETDSLYRAVQRWLLAEIPQQDHHYLTAGTQTVYVDTSGEVSDNHSGDFLDQILESPKGGGGYSETRILTTLDSAIEFQIRVDEHDVAVSIDSGGSDHGEESGRERGYRRGAVQVKNSKIIFRTRSVVAQDAVLAKLESLVAGRNKRKPSLWIADGWGQWRSQDAPVRKLSSVVLADGVKEDLMADLTKFLSDEPKYAELGIPWHRGLLLHGPAGTGKTSLIKALAAEMGLDLWYAPLGDLKEDSALLDLVRSVKARGILLLEDVDSYTAARDRDDESSNQKEGVSTSALLNALDGVITPHGLITIMTTNHYEKLDPALVRSGRADRVIELGLPGWSEVEQLWTLFFPNEFGLGAEPEGFATSGISQAGISEVFKRYWDEPELARKHLMEKFDDSHRK